MVLGLWVSLVAPNADAQIRYMQDGRQAHVYMWANDFAYEAADVTETPADLQPFHSSIDRTVSDATDNSSAWATGRTT